MENWRAGVSIVVGLKQPKVLVWLNTIQCFAQHEGIFSIAILDEQHPALSSWI